MSPRSLRYAVKRRAEGQWLIVDNETADRKAVASFKSRRHAREAAKQMNAGRHPLGASQAQPQQA
jgi:hypothetical protein